MPDSVRGNGNLFQKLARAYKQINAPVGQLGLATLGISNTALSSGSSLDDSTYTQLESQLAAINSQRDAIAGQIIQVLEDAEFNGKPINPATVRYCCNRQISCCKLP